MGTRQPTNVFQVWSNCEAVCFQNIIDSLQTLASVGCQVPPVPALVTLLTETDPLTRSKLQSWTMSVSVVRLLFRYYNNTHYWHYDVWLNDDWHDRKYDDRQHCHHKHDVWSVTANQYKTILLHLGTLCFCLVRIRATGQTNYNHHAVPRSVSVISTNVVASEHTHSRSHERTHSRTN